LTRLPPWPRSIPRVFRPIATIRLDTGSLSPRKALDRLYERYAAERAYQQSRIQCSGLTGQWTERIFANRADFTAFANSAAEGSLLSGLNVQPVLPALFFDGNRGFGRGTSFLARGVMSNTSTPTIIFQTRLGTTSGSSFLSGASCGVSPTITTASTISNKLWELRLDLTCYTPGIGAGNCTLSGVGYVQSAGAFASPFWYALEPTTPDTATWTIAIDDSVTQYFNLSVTWSAASASNTIICKQLYCDGWN
jgi:hypothetical protein